MRLEGVFLIVTDSVELRCRLPLPDPERSTFADGVGVVGFPPEESRGGLGSEGDAMIVGDAAARFVEDMRRKCFPEPLCDTDAGPREESDVDKATEGGSPCARTGGLDMVERRGAGVDSWERAVIKTRQRLTRKAGRM